MFLSTKCLAELEEKQLSYAQQLGELLPEPRWEADKKKIIDENRDDEFHLLVNMKKIKITWHHNLSKCLGYNVDQELDDSFFDVLIHPFILDYYNAFAIAMHDLIIEAKDKISYMNMRYKITVPMRKADGDYTCVQQIIYPTQFDTKGHVYFYYVRYIMNGTYLGQPLQPTIMLDREVLYESVKRFHQITASLMDIEDERLMFSRDELRVLEEAYKVRFEAQRNDLLQKTMRLSIKHSNAKIKSKTKSMFITPLEKIPKQERIGNFNTCLPKLEDVYQIAEFLHHSDITHVMNYKLRNQY